MYKCCIEINIGYKQNQENICTTCTSVVLKFKTETKTAIKPFGSTCTSVVLKFMRHIELRINLSCSTCTSVVLK